jgi:L-rhamnonate dehydratase
MLRRSFLALTALAPAAALAFQSEKSKLKITGVRLVNPRLRRPVPNYTPAPGSWSTTGVEVASPMSIYPDYKSNRALFMPEPSSLEGFTVEIATDKDVKGYGEGGMAGGVIVEKHLTKLLLGKDPFDIERIWDILWRSTMYYDRAGIATNAISGIDLALWDLIGNALGVPVYKLLGGETKPHPGYCTGNDLNSTSSSASSG